MVVIAQHRPASNKQKRPRLWPRIVGPNKPFARATTAAPTTMSAPITTTPSTPFHVSVIPIVPWDGSDRRDDAPMRQRAQFGKKKVERTCGMPPKTTNRQKSRQRVSKKGKIVFCLSIAGTNERTNKKRSGLPTRSTRYQRVPFFRHARPSSCPIFPWTLSVRWVCYGD
jgi:hypothetical protein